MGWIIKEYNDDDLSIVEDKILSEINKLKAPSKGYLQSCY